MKNSQYSYTIDNIGRVHIEITNDLVSHIIIDDTKDFYYDRKMYPIVEDDYTLKIGIELIKFSSGKIFDLKSIPIFIQLTEFMNKFYSMILDIPYGETRNLKDLVTKGQLGRARKLINECPLQLLIPIHRVIDNKIDQNLNYYLDKIRLLESSVKNSET